MKNIYIIEDDSIMLGALQAKLCVKGNKCSLENGQSEPEAIISGIKAEKPDLIILDYSLPKITGKEMLKMLKSEPEINSIPVFLLLEEREKELADKLQHSGAELILIKSGINSDELVDKMIKVIKNKKI